jgi:hypothetical protein
MVSLIIAHVGVSNFIEYEFKYAFILFCSIFGYFYLFFEYVQLTNVVCDFGTESFDQIGSIYRCKVLNDLQITSKQESVIASAKGWDNSGGSYDFVEGFLVYNKSVQYFPRNLENVFKNIRKISITDGRLKELNQEDLKPFPKLVNFYLDDNDIEILEEGVFAYNPDLVFILLSNNKLVHIGQNVFEILTNLTYLYLSYNPCINMKAENNSIALKIIVDTTKLNCTNLGFVILKNHQSKLQDDDYLVTMKTIEKLTNLENAQHVKNLVMLVGLFIQAIILVVGYISIIRMRVNGD